jgi:hypothetical protein
MSAAYVLEALHDEAMHEQGRRGLVQGRALVEQLVRQAIADGHIDFQPRPGDRDQPAPRPHRLHLPDRTRRDRPQDVLAAIDVHLDRLFRST